jgi:hypothetical protein
MTVPGQLDQRDIGALIGLLAVLEGAVMVGDLPLDQGLRLRRRLVEVGLLSVDQPYSDFAAALGALNQRVRVLEDPASTTRPAELVESVLAFPEAAGAEAFAEQLRGAGRVVVGPVHEPSLRRWTVVVRTPWPAGTPFPHAGPEAAAASSLGGWHLGAS